MRGVSWVSVMSIIFVGREGRLLMRAVCLDLVESVLEVTLGLGV